MNRIFATLKARDFVSKFARVCRISREINERLKLKVKYLECARAWTKLGIFDSNCSTVTATTLGKIFRGRYRNTSYNNFRFARFLQTLRFKACTEICFSWFLLGNLNPNLNLLQSTLSIASMELVVVESTNLNVWRFRTSIFRCNYRMLNAQALNCNDKFRGSRLSR